MLVKHSGKKKNNTTLFQIAKIHLTWYFRQFALINWPTLKRYRMEKSFTRLLTDSDETSEEDQHCEGGGVGDVVQDPHDL